MKAKDIVKVLDEDNFWVNEISTKDFPFISKMATPPSKLFFSEVTVRIPTSEKTRFGKPKPQRRRFDAIAFIKPHYKAFGDDLFAIGVEIKVSKSDLLGDEKYLDYLGYTKYMFFAVPSHLIDFCQEKLDIEKNELHAFFGIIEAEKKEIVRMPQEKFVSAVNRSLLFQELLNKQLKSNGTNQRKYRN